MDLPRLHQNGATAHVLCTFSKSRVDLYKLSGVGFCSIAMDFEGQKPLAHALSNTWCAEFSQNLRSLGDCSFGGCHDIYWCESSCDKLCLGWNTDTLAYRAAVRPRSEQIHSKIPEVIPGHSQVGHSWAPGRRRNSPYSRAL